MRWIVAMCLPGSLLAVLTVSSQAQDPATAAPRGKSAAAAPAGAPGGQSPGMAVPAKGAAPAPGKAAGAPATKGAAPAGTQDQTPAATPVDPAAQQRLDQLLTEWERQSAAIKSLDAKFFRLDNNKVLGEIEFFEGRALLKSPNFACLDTKKLDLDPKKEAQLFMDAVKFYRAQNGEPAPGTEPIPAARKKFFDRIICTGESIYHYDGSVKQVFEYPLAKQDRAAALQQGPLPFLFDMRREEVLRRYNMRLVKEDDEKYTIQVAPKLEIDRSAFEQAVIHLNKKTFQPDVLMLVEPNKNQQIYYLTRVRANEPVNDQNFQHQSDVWKKMGYELVRNPAPSAQPAATAAPKAAAKGEAGTPQTKGTNRR